MNDAPKEHSGGTGLTWVKSSLSFANSNCVEATRMDGGVVGIRDSKDPRGAVLRFTPAEWTAFIGGVRNGDFDALAGQHGT